MWYSWGHCYAPVYLDEQQIIHQRGTLFQAKELVKMANTEQVPIKQGTLARRFDYGSLLLLGAASQPTASLSDIPEPAQHAALLPNRYIHRRFQV